MVIPAESARTVEGQLFDGLRRGRHCSRFAMSRKPRCPLSGQHTTGSFQIRAIAYHNCNDVQLFWRVSVSGADDAPLEGCLGFMIERQRRAKDGSWSPPEILRNKVAFVDQPPPNPSDPKDFSRPSSVWPFQRYEWTDHGANDGAVVQYNIHAVAPSPGGVIGETAMTSIAQSGWFGPIDVSAEAGEGAEAYFNRGFVMSQFMSRIMREKEWKVGDIKKHLKEIEEPTRRFLSGELRLALLRLLDEAINDPRMEFYLAIYELSDDELIGRLKLLKGRAHLVLSNGSDKKGDGNADARSVLNKAGVDVHDRILGSRGLGHNKFAVLTRSKDRQPLVVWTGSTNWSPSGLCTQVNNGILLTNEKIAQLYLDQWDRLVDAGDAFTSKLVAENAKSPRDEGATNVWFTRVRNKSKKNVDDGADIVALVNQVSAAKSMILYVMFQPGPEPLTTILQRGDNVYVRGVVSAVTASNKEKFQLSGIDMDAPNYQSELIQPDGIKQNFGAWLKEVTRGQFLMPFQNPGVGHAITHSKIIVIDPFADDCKVITGSHNFSAAASEQNDDNFIVVTGNKMLAEAYAVACLATYEHYAWRAYVKDKMDKGEPVWSHLSDDPGWQRTYLTRNRIRHLKTWCP